MGAQEKFDQVAGIFTRHEVPFGVSNDGTSLRVLSGSAAVLVSVVEFGSRSVIHLHSPVVVGLDMSDHDVVGKAFAAANALNRDKYLAKFSVYEGALVAELDLLGEDLQAQELMDGLVILAGIVDDIDDGLATELRGRTYESAFGEGTVVTDT
jgi:hypothetical protein